MHCSIAHMRSGNVVKALIHRIDHWGNVLRHTSPERRVHDRIIPEVVVRTDAESRVALQVFFARWSAVREFRLIDEGSATVKLHHRLFKVIQWTLCDTVMVAEMLQE